MKLTRPLTKAELAKYWSERARYFEAADADLSQVTQMDSVGLAFLVQWSQALANTGKTLELRSPPAAFHSLAQLYGVGQLFTLTPNNPGSQHGSE
ncbi:STAS domain-containing protein [Zobellella maritima]|uniref:STAS domain-containing protein n=1 Tax=Zobellella maritima TaxID=2059725 RepID=UPI000E3089B4|nr:STAS domain-containing protein [Zobellella maritima]